MSVEVYEDVMLKMFTDSISVLKYLLYFSGRKICID